MGLHKAVKQLVIGVGVVAGVATSVVYYKSVQGMLQGTQDLLERASFQNTCVYNERAQPKQSMPFESAFCITLDQSLAEKVNEYSTTTREGAPAILRQYFMRSTDHTPLYESMHEKQDGKWLLQSLTSLVDGYTVFADSKGNMLCWEPNRILFPLRYTTPENLLPCPPRSPQPQAISRSA